MNKKYIAGFLALMACAAAASGAYAFGGFFGNGPQNNDAARQALDSSDYEAFVEAISPKITEEQFQQMAERNQAGQAIEQALEEGDYAAWVQAIESMPKITDIITEENFARFAEMHEAMQNGDYETAKEIAEELGIGCIHAQKGFRAVSKFGMRGNLPHGQWQEGN